MAVLMSYEEIKAMQQYLETYPEEKEYYEGLKTQEQKDMYIINTKNTIYFQSFLLQMKYKELGRKIKEAFKRVWD